MSAGFPEWLREHQLAAELAKMRKEAADLLARTAPKGLLMVRDELAGWLFGMGAYNAGARAFWLECARADAARRGRPK